jgi:hypothetical protein
MNDNIIIIRSVFGKVEQSFFIQPCPNPKTGQLPAHVKPINSNGDMILSEKDRTEMSLGAIFIAADEAIEIVDGTMFDLDNDYQKARWEAIQYSKLIATERTATNEQGEFLIDGGQKRYGIADLYIQRPGEDTKIKNTKKRLVIKAQSFVLEDSQDGRVTKCKLLGKEMGSAHYSDVEDYLLSIAEKTPNKIIDLYTGTDTEVRMLLIDALKAGVILIKSGIYTYGDYVNLGVTENAAVAWLKQQGNAKLVAEINSETYPDFNKVEKPTSKK